MWEIFLRNDVLHVTVIIEKNSKEERDSYVT